MSRNQPQYDFLTGGVPAANESFRSSHMVKADIGNEELRTHLHKLEYEVDSLRQEREVTSVRHQEDIRIIKKNAEDQYKRALESESLNQVSSSKYDALIQEHQELQDTYVAEKSQLEKKLRAAQEDCQTAQEDAEEARTELASQERQFKHAQNELESRNKSDQQVLEEIRADRDEKSASLQSTSQRLSQREQEISDLENEVMRLKTQTGDVDTLAVIKRELSEQVAHIQKLEAINTDQRIELKQMRKQQKPVEVVEEEKRTLEGKLRAMDTLKRELNEAQLQRQLLEDERRSWSAYLENASTEDEDVRFERPEDLAKAYVQERIERASLLDQLGKVSPELSAKDTIIQSLDDEKSQLKQEIEKLRTAGGPVDTKVMARLERQRALAVKEVEYLRAQIKAFDAEESELQGEKYDEQRSKRIQELEDIVDEYRKEVQTLQENLGKSEEQAKLSPTTGSKRSRDDDEDGEKQDERLGELSRKNRTLQDDLTKSQKTQAVLEKELSAAKSQLSSFKSTSRTRILELRSNPTSNFETVKQSALENLRAENTSLLAQLENKHQKRPSSAYVPQETVERLRADLAVKDDALASKDKHMARLKEIMSAKSREFREAVASILGWKLNFMPNGRVRVTSVFNPGSSSDDDEEGSKSIVFDGENGTMKVSGGPQSAFANEIRGQIDYWVDGRKEIPCFLAACTLEFWEKSTRAQKV